MREVRKGEGKYNVVAIGAGTAGLVTAAGARERSAWEYVLLAVGPAATVAVTIHVTRLARKALKETEVAEAT